MAEGLFVQASRGDGTPVERFPRDAVSIKSHIRGLIVVLDCRVCRNQRCPLFSPQSFLAAVQIALLHHFLEDVLQIIATDI